MIRSGFLSAADRADLIALAKDGSAAHRLARRANAIVLLDASYGFKKVAQVLLLDDGTIRAWHKMFIEGGLEGLTCFEPGGSVCRIGGEQQSKLKAWVASAYKFHINSYVLRRHVLRAKLPKLIFRAGRRKAQAMRGVLTESN